MSLISLAAQGVNVVRSSSSGAFTTTSASFVEVTNLTKVIQLTGNKPVLCFLQANTTNDGAIELTGTTVSEVGAQFRFFDGTTGFGGSSMKWSESGLSATVEYDIPGSSFAGLDPSPAAGAVTYSFQCKRSDGSTSILVDECLLVVIEL